MYTLTIAKIKGNVWGGFLNMSEILPEEKVKQEVNYYGGDFKSPVGDELVIVELEWHGNTILIQYRKI